MRKAILLTAYNRHDYLADALDTWTSVRGIEDWDFYISIDEDKSEDNLDVIQLANYFQRKLKTDVYIIRQFPKLGVLRHPFVALQGLFDSGYDFVLRTEDDLLVSDGILDYFEWAARSFAFADDVKTVHGYSALEVGDEAIVTAEHRFNPWTFGTWKRAWPDLADNWDLNYSTYNGSPGVESGFDWNFNTRVYPSKLWFGIHPEVSRVKNIGAYGVHGTPENLPKSPTYNENNTLRGEHFELQL